METAKKPKIRFKGFTNAWEQQTLSNISTRVFRKNTNLESTLPLTISAQYGLVDQYTYFNNRVASKNLSNYFLLKKGEFAYNKSYSDGYPFGAVKCLENYDQGVLSTLYIIFKPNNKLVDSQYLIAYYDTDNWHKEVAERASEGARNHGLLNISADDFFDTKLTISKNLSEQTKIGTFLKQVDKLITLHQRKCEKLQNIKKSLLEKMFPKNNEKFPAIRFKGFTNAWEQCKLQEVIEEYIEKTTIQNQYPVLTSSQQKGIILQEEYFSNRQITTNDNIGYYVLPYGYFTYRSRSDTDIFVFNRNNIINKGIISYFYPVFSAKNVDATFLLYRLNNGTKKQIRIAAEGTGQHVLSIKKFKEIKALFPLTEEQTQIGKTLETIDKLLTLHQRQVEKLQNIKKALLEKMFV